MESNDKIFNQFKNAAQNVAPKDFASMESVWNRVEDKLDKTVIKQETKTWRKIAVAASILLCVSIGFQVFRTKQDVVLPNNQVVTNEVKKDMIDYLPEKSNSEIAPEYPNINENADAILQNSIKTNDIVAYNEPTTSAMASPSPIILAAPAANDEIAVEKDFVNSDKIISNKPLAKSGSHFFKTKIYDAISVHRNYEEVSKQEAVVIAQEETNKKQNPLYVIDGEAVANNKNSDAKSKLDANNIENIVVLKEPLYIIDGIEYSEASLFDEKPTSPYAPLDKQEIIKTIILQGNEAEEIYGEKGKKGVVIVTTKNGKPAKK